jgi:GTPase SAR1 family protein
MKTPREREVVVLGPSASGKSTLLRALEQPTRNNLTQAHPPHHDELYDAPYHPTVGVEMVRLKPKRSKDPQRRKQQQQQQQQLTALTLREVGGAMMSAWDAWYENAAALIFVADTSSLAALAAAAAEFYAAISAPALAHKPTLLVLGKRDVAGAVDVEIARRILRLGELQAGARGKGGLTVCEASAAAPVSVLGWLDELQGILQ